LLAACQSSGQTKESLTVIEVTQRMTAMSGAYLDPLARRSGDRFVSAEEAVDAARSFPDMDDAIDGAGKLRIFLGDSGSRTRRREGRPT
jgi:hypothetical protein